MASRLKGAYSVALGLLVALALIIVVLPLATNGEWRTVQTGSMEPDISAGDVVLITPQPTALDVGDVVAFADPLRPERDILHRVVAIDGQGFLITKGDANDVPDPWIVAPSEIIGTRLLSIPALGFLVETVGSDLGILFFLVVPALLIIFNESKVWYRYVRYGNLAIASPARGKHLAGRGRRTGRSAA